MAKHGSVGEYKPGIEEWTAYAEHVGHYFTANDITDDGKKQAIFLRVCGPSTYGLIRSLVAPKTATEHSYTELVELVKKHYNPRPSTIMQRFKFNSRVRQLGETGLSTLQSCVNYLNTVISKTPWKIRFGTGWCGASLTPAYSIACYQKTS